MQKYLFRILLALSLFAIAIPALAVSWDYYVPVTLTDNTSTDRSELVAFTGVNTQNLIDSSYLNASGNQTALLEGSTARPYMVTDNNSLFFVPTLLANQTRTYNLYTGYSPAQQMNILVGENGYLTTVDSPNLYPTEENFSVEVSGYLKDANGIIYSHPNQTVIETSSDTVTAIICTSSENITTSAAYTPEAQSIKVEGILTPSAGIGTTSDYVDSEEGAVGFPLQTFTNAVRVDNGTIAMFFTGSGASYGDGYARTYEIADNATITINPIDTWHFDDLSGGGFGGILSFGDGKRALEVSPNIFAVVMQRGNGFTNSYLVLDTFTIANDGTITTSLTGQLITSVLLNNGTIRGISRVGTSNIYVVSVMRPYGTPDYYNTIYTFEISSDGTTITQKDSWDYTSSAITGTQGASITWLRDSIIGIAYDNSIKTVSINTTTGAITKSYLDTETISVGDTIEYPTIDGLTDSGLAAAKWAGTDVYMRTFSVDASGVITLLSAKTTIYDPALLGSGRPPTVVFGEDSTYVYTVTVCTDSLYYARNETYKINKSTGALTYIDYGAFANNGSVGGFSYPTIVGAGNVWVEPMTTSPGSSTLYITTFTVVDTNIGDWDITNNLYIDGIPVDTAVGSGTLNDSSDNITIMSNVTPYLDYVKITIAGTEVVWYQPTEMISGTTLPDRDTATVENAIITWGTGPTAVPSGIVSSEPPIHNVTEGIMYPLPDVVEPQGWNVSGTFGGILTPEVKEVFSNAASDMGMPEQSFWIMFIFGIAIAIGLSVMIFTGSILIAMTMATVVIWYGNKQGIVDFGLVILLIILEVGVYYLTKQHS